MHNRIDPSQARQAALRVMARSDDLAAISEDDGQLTRVYLSAEHFRANRQVAEWMRQAGMETWQDAVGNICGRYEGQTANAPAILLGSHLDSVRNAGRYDGPLGVLSAIETVSWLNEQQIRLPVAIEVIGFADEEGTRFGITLLGSKGITGRWPAAWVDHPDHQGVTVAQAMQASGLDATKIATAARHRDAIIAYLELHIEQGPCLEQAGLALGVVTAINGARRLNCQFTGQAGHAGTVPMTHRKDALAAAAEWMVFVENCTQQRGHRWWQPSGPLPVSPAQSMLSPEKPGYLWISADLKMARWHHYRRAYLKRVSVLLNGGVCGLPPKNTMGSRPLPAIPACGMHSVMRWPKYRDSPCYCPAVPGMMRLRLPNAGRWRCCLYAVRGD